MGDNALYHASLLENNQNYFLAYDSYQQCGKTEFTEQRMLSCLKNMNLWSVIAEQAVVKQDTRLLLESFVHLNRWEFLFTFEVICSEIESILTHPKEETDLAKSLSLSILHIQVLINQGNQDSITHLSRHIETQLILAHRQSLTLSQKRHIQFLAQVMYNLLLISQLLNGSSIGMPIMMHLRDNALGESDFMSDRVMLLRMRQYYYAKMEEEGLSNDAVGPSSDFEWSTIQIAKLFLKEQDYPSVLETLITGSHNKFVTTRYVQQAGSILADLSLETDQCPEINMSLLEHLVYNLEFFRKSESGALMTTYASLMRNDEIDDTEEIQSLLMQSTHLDPDNKHTWYQLASLYFSKSINNTGSTQLNQNVVLSVIVYALRLNESDPSLILWFFFILAYRYNNITDEFYKTIDIIPLHVFLPYLFYLYIPNSAIHSFSRRITQALVSAFPQPVLYYLDWNRSLILNEFTSSTSYLQGNIVSSKVVIVNILHV